MAKVEYFNIFKKCVFFLSPIILLGAMVYNYDSSNIINKCDNTNVPRKFKDSINLYERRQYDEAVRFREEGLSACMSESEAEMLRYFEGQNYTAQQLGIGSADLKVYNTLIAAGYTSEEAKSNAKKIRELCQRQGLSGCQ